MKGPKGSHRTVYIDQLSEERDGELSDYVFVGNARVARIGGAKLVPVAAGILAAFPPLVASAAVVLLLAAMLSGLLGGRRRWARPLVAETVNGPWGERLSGSSEPYGFTGKEWEADAGLYDFGARIYDPVIGRFLSPDPASIAKPELGIGDPQLGAVNR